ncbi:glycine cleavage system aminomethyltransferase GcvT [Larsenimonas rhizosphaerae]|uniref:glycine cleavage system aminomethyltransferase GcvT n=1 Tax=Larsenimonas rhizosphaerae TaxID=2944682 RepID=UPI0020349E42|nr:glycine cleavage system aminomethyltransferase GcvT [Larsenimonas rhizosphaerae]MCM2130725.1 glycine cleavage system aminomethyltransferase GcvT [Larsenimonas rhizosphaerae]
MTTPHRTPLYPLHEALGARFVPFAGYDMPVHYPAGVKQEHEHTRRACSLFDVSHMGQILLYGDEAAQALETLVCADLVDLAQGRQRYALFTTSTGGVYDDLMVANQGDCLYLVVNASRKDNDMALLRTGLSGDVRIDMQERALLALQGPQAVDVLADFNPAVRDMTFMDHQRMTFSDIPVWVSRAGYTGEDGFEISVSSEQAVELAQRLLAYEQVAPAGLGARDSLRLEAGLCLYGHDLTEHTTPIEAALPWAIGKARRQGGEREGGFPGGDVILTQLANRDHLQQRVGLIAEGRAPVREGAELYSEQDSRLGEVCSGGFGPTIGKPIAMAYLPVDFCQPGTRVWAEVRGKRHAMTVTTTPFVTPGYAR